MRAVKIFLLALLVATLAIACVGCGSSGDTAGGNENEFFLSYHIDAMTVGEDVHYRLQEEFRNTDDPGQVTINPGDTFVAITPPAIDGYRFVGWCEDVYDGEFYVETKMWEAGEPLPTDRHVAVRTVYEPLSYTLTCYAYGEAISTRQLEGATKFINANILDPDKLAIDSDWYYHHGYDVIYDLYVDQDLASKLSEKNGFDYSPDHFYYCDIYLDEAMTQPLTELTVTDDVSLYAKFVYSPVYFEYIDSEDAYTVSYLCGDLPGGVLEFPEIFAGCDVISIKDHAFASNTKIKEVILPSSLKSIGIGAFSNSAIESVYIPEGVEYIGSGAFSGCAALITVDIKSDVEFEFTDVFADCNSIQHEQYFGAYYFRNTFISAIEGYTGEVKIKPGCTEIPADAFAGYSITELTIPDSVVEIGSGAFKNSTIVAVTIPASVALIGDEAFAGTLIVDITIPATVTTIGDGAFKDCELLSTYTIETTAGFEFSNLFENCPSITGEEYGNAYYYGNEFIRPINKDITWAMIKPGCERVPENAFRDCTKLSKVYLPQSVKSVGTYAFYNVNSLYFTPYIESYTATSILWDEHALTTIHPETGEELMYKRGDFPTSVLLDENGIAYAIESMKNYTGSGQNGCVIYGCFTNASEITIAAEYNTQPVKVIYPNAFMDNDTLVKLTVESCAVVGSAAFWNATALKEITFKTCSHIGIRAFYGCSSLETVTFESEFLIFVGKQAFEGCESLSDVKVNNLLIAWNEDFSESVEIAPNTNIADALKGNKLYWCFADEEVTKEQLQALMSQVVV